MAKTTLSQIVAVRTAVTSDTVKEFAALAAVSRDPAPLTGMRRTYTKSFDDGDDFPPENVRVHHTVTDLNDRVRQLLTRAYNVEATNDWGNTRAKADVAVDGQVIIEGAPVSFLMWLDKRLDELGAYFARLPVLDPSEDWSPVDDRAGLHATPPVKTIKTQKAVKPLTLYEATPEHPAQVDKITYDKAIGEWTIVKLSGAIPGQERLRLIDRVRTLRDAVKRAREEANFIEVDDVLVGEAIFGYLLDRSTS